MNQTASVEAVLARAEDGRFKEVEHLVRIDSATSRLQLAHGVASAR